MIFKDLVTESHIERHYGNAGAFLLRFVEVRSGIRNDPDHVWSIDSLLTHITSLQRQRSLGSAKPTMLNLYGDDALSHRGRRVAAQPTADLDRLPRLSADGLAHHPPRPRAATPGAEPLDGAADRAAGRTQCLRRKGRCGCGATWHPDAAVPREASRLVRLPGRDLLDRRRGDRECPAAALRTTRQQRRRDRAPARPTGAPPKRWESAGRQRYRVLPERLLRHPPRRRS